MDSTTPLKKLFDEFTDDLKHATTPTRDALEEFERQLVLLDQRRLAAPPHERAELDQASVAARDWLSKAREELEHPTILSPPARELNAFARAHPERGVPDMQWGGFER
ncbi:hypothetical protein ACWDOP_00380 [Nocardia sp. NPDC003693]